MRLAATTYCFRRLPLAEALDAIAATGLRDVEVWLPHAREGAEAAREALEARGLRAVAVSAGGAYAPGDDAVARGGRLALALGAPVVVSCAAPGLLPGLVAELDPRVTLCLENHWDQPVARAADVLRELGAAPRARACLDTGHALAAGEDPRMSARALGGRLGHVHLKDGRRASALWRLAGPRLRRRLGRAVAPVRPGSGDLDVASLAAELAGLGYAGAVSVEVEGGDAPAGVAALAAAWRRALPE